MRLSCSNFRNSALATFSKVERGISSTNRFLDAFVPPDAAPGNCAQS